MRIFRLFSFLLLLAFAMTSCNKNRLVDCLPSSNPIILRIFNANGEDMLNPATPGSFKEEDIFISGFEGAEVDSVPGTTAIFGLHVSLPDEPAGEKYTTIRLSPTEVDTIFYHTEVMDASVHCPSYTFSQFRYNAISYTSSGSAGTNNYEDIYKIIK